MLFWLSLLISINQHRTNSSSSSKVAWRVEQRRSKRKCSFPEVRATKIEKGNWSARSESCLHAEQQQGFYEGVERLGLFDWAGLLHNISIPCPLTKRDSMHVQCWHSRNIFGDLHKFVLLLQINTGCIQMSAHKPVFRYLIITQIDDGKGDHSQTTPVIRQFG